MLLLVLFISLQYYSYAWGYYPNRPSTSTGTKCTTPNLLSRRNSLFSKRTIQSAFKLNNINANSFTDYNPGDGSTGVNNGEEQYPLDFGDGPDFFPALADEELLEQMRLERQLDNDRWQSILFRDQQSGSYTGSFQLYVPLLRDGRLGLSRRAAGMVSTRVSTQEMKPDGVRLLIAEEYRAEAGPVLGALEVLLQETRRELIPSQLRLAEGNQVIGNAFTFVADVEPGLSREDVYVTELCIREGPLRVRVRYAYSKLANVGVSPEDSFALGLLGMLVVKEAEVTSTPAQIQPLFDERVGGSLYDPQVFSEDYLTISFPGRLTLFFPRGLRLGERGVLSVQWEGSAMMYQADRKFQDLSGAIKTLELTEIQPSDAAAYPPSGVIRKGGGKNTKVY